MPIALGLVCSAASLTLMAVVAWMNYRFMSGLGSSPEDGQALAFGSVAVDVMLGVLAPLIHWSATGKRWLYATVGVVLAIGCAGLSLISAIGFAAEGRARAAAKGDTEKVKIEIAAGAVARLEKREQMLGAPRPKHVIEAAIADMESDRQWRTSKACTRTQAGLSTWCAQARKLIAERQAAKELEEVGSALETARKHYVDLKEKAADVSSDAQISLMARMMGAADADVRTILVLLVGIVMEMGGGLGLAMGLAPWLAYREERRRSRLVKPDAGGHFAISATLDPRKADGARRRATPNSEAETLVGPADSGRRLRTRKSSRSKPH